MNLLEQIEKEAKGLDFESLSALKSESQEKHIAWFESRRGKFTASEFHRLMGYEDKQDFPKGADTYVLEKVLEILTIRDEDTYSNANMDWGNLNEKEAVERFMEEFELEVEKYGEEQEFIQLGNNIGCTPDGLISSIKGVEVKCPKSMTQLSRLKIKDQEQFKKECKNYYWQIQGSMYITGRASWYFVSYDPRFKSKYHQLKVIEINRNDEDIKKLKSRLQEAIKKRDKYLKEYDLQH
ncbi:YqaJ recombinase family protein [Tenacibaculum maritimum]|uniref:lambda exonuclease family protein n=1 Tax=Tenacibaculum maritimum TaxID=107401 RepID=UPI0012E5BAF5|nr:lambda exonuclease family protein [Tenacibaculum maritimum]CAA0196492.1 YqaJ recombinase family protein [Tenacibaculum maritimum]